ncbi:MAG TPA: FKBP-type peptidyl-prolyl cis-trans isomerase [Ferruginibacter sp.]|nr:FKBP-type peptidyl-prolyl cis-trans isomerase [Ferruginibacter sp.]
MKKMLTLLVAIPLLFISCKKEDKCPYSESGASASTAERTYLANYLAANSIAAIEHTSGVYYNIAAPGAGKSPSICSNITAKYTGSLIPSGNVFDGTPAGSAGISFTLGQLIVGWQKVLPLLKTNGKITLYIPPSLGYGNQDISDQGNVIIPANSYLKFEIELVNVQ